jgi:hypothetical protein
MHESAQAEIVGFLIRLHVRPLEPDRRGRPGHDPPERVETDR